MSGLSRRLVKLDACDLPHLPHRANASHTPTIHSTCRSRVPSGRHQPYLTARQLLRDPPRLQSLHGRCVYVCENPTVVAEAANSVGAASAPLVCASGHPAGAATVLLRQLAEAGARLRYHGDFDWPGITIANGLFTRFGVGPWRFDAAAYRAAASSGGAPLRGRSVQATWDTELTEAMVTLGRKIEEEQVLASLLADLERSG